MHTHHSSLTIKMKGALLDRIFNLLRDGNINKVPGTTFSAILSRVRGQNLGWRFFIDSISKLSEAGEAEEHFFLKSLKTKLLQKYPTAIDELMTKYRANSAKKQKLQVDFLIDILNGINYGEKLENYEDYCEHHYGFISVLTDIIQVDAHESNIDTIDCF